MGTRGCWGFRIDGQDKLTYNHYDSYPTGLGKDLVEALQTIPLAELKDKARALRLVDGDDTPTKKEREELREFANLRVSHGTDEDWYCLLRETQGNMTATFKAGVMIDSHDFLENSLFCEWAYIINLDSGEFETYKGFQQKYHSHGRYYSTMAKEGYYPVALVKQYRLQDIPQDWAEQLEKEDE